MELFVSWISFSLWDSLPIYRGHGVVVFVYTHVEATGQPHFAVFCCFLALNLRRPPVLAHGWALGGFWLGGQPQRGEQADPERPKDVGLEREKKKEKKEREKENGKK